MNPGRFSFVVMESPVKSPVNLQELDLSTEMGQQVHLSYEEAGDILEIVFHGVPATSAIELTDNILLSFNREMGEAAGLTILGFSVITAATELGPCSFALTGLDDLPEKLRDVVVHIITQPPVNEFLKVVSFYTPSAQVIPLTYLESPKVLLPAV